MRFALLCCALCATFAPPAAGELITIDGGHFDRVNVPVGRELLFTGGSIEYLNNNGGVATIDGGVLTGIFATGSRVTWGGTVTFLKSPHVQGFESIVEGGQQGRVNRTILEGLAFRVHRDADAPSGTELAIEGIMLDGSPLAFNFFRLGNRDLHHLEFITHPEAIFDPTGDALFDLDDLNIIRNHFGAAGGRTEGDADGDGLVGLADLNLARNQFGYSWKLPSEDQFSGVWDFSPPRAVPEPATWALALLFVTAAWFGTAGR